MESAAGSSGAALPYPDTTRKRRRSQSPPPAGERSTERKFAKLRGGGGGAAAVWENLDLLLSLQGKDSSLQRKIELAFNFLTTESNQSNHGDRAHSIQLLRAVSFIGNWVQPILPKNSKKMSEPFDPALDYRCWVILRVCIEKKPSLSISPNLLKSLTHVVRHAFIRVNTGASCDNDEPFRLFEQVLDCISLLFSSNTRAFFNAGVDLWASCAIEAVNLAQKVSTNEKNGCHEGFALRKLGVCLLEQFSSFLRFYANPKNMFRVFVDRVLDLLLELLVLLHSQANSGNHKQARTMLKIVEDILSNGLFHPQHISGYFGLKNLNKRSEAKDVKGSYHRHLFNRFKGIKAENKAVLLAGFGYLLQLFVSRVRNQRTSFALKGTTFNSLLRSNEASEESQDCRKPLFEVFMQFIEVLVLECRGYSQKDFSNLGVTRLVEIHCMLKSMNDILTTLIKEKIYLPTEDTMEGSYFKFLQEIYNMLISIADKIYQFWISTIHVQDAIIKMLPLISTEIIIAVGYFLEIEYKVMGDDLVQLWLMIFALSAINSSSEDVKPCLLLASKIAKLSSQVICTFSELRQVTYSIFRLCDAVRIFGSVDADVVSNSFSVASLSSQKCLESLTTLLSSQILRDAIFNSIYSMPEGQSSRCIEELTLDITHTLKWIKACSFEDDDLKSQGKSTSITSVPVVGQKAELVGRHLSELYIAVLDSVTVTASNSTLVGKSVERLLNAIRPSFSHLVQNKPSNLNESIFSFIGNFIPSNQHEDCQKNPSWSWVFVFFFRLYISCRSLYRQCVSLMPPELAIEASESMGNLFIVCSGKEWTNAANILTEGYFAWIVESSNSLLDVIKALSESLSRNHDGYALLVYVLHMMALQRLNDLDRQIKAFDFLLEDDAQQFDRENRGNPGLFKESCTYEAAQLTSFMMGYMRLLFSGEKDSFQGDEISCASQHFLHNSATWDLSLCSLDEGSLPVATWRLLCENIDIWRSYASKKDLKNFFSNLINFSFVQKRSCKHKDENVASQTLYRKQTLHNVSLKLLHDTIIYDQKVLSKNLASSFFRVLKNLVSSFVNNTYGVNALLDSLPDLSEAFHNLENKQLVNTDVDATRLHSLDELQICENLLDFFSTVPGIHAHSKPFLRFLTYILHLERFLLAKLLNGCNGSSTGNPTELLQLFLSCRRAMQNLIFSLSEECPQSKLYSAFSKFFGNSSCLIWLLRSVQEVVDLSHKIFVENTDQVKCIMLSLVDKTAQIFSTLTNMNSVFCLRADKKQVAPNGSPDEGNASENGGQTFDILENSALKCVRIMAGLLENSTSSIPVTIKDCKHTIKVGNCCDILCWDKILCIMSCIQGFLWGLISALESTIKDYSAASPQERKVTLHYASRFSKYIVKFEAFVDLCLYILFVEDHGSVSSICVHLPQEASCENGFLKFDALVDEWSKHRNCEVGIPHVHHAEAEVEDINRSTLYPSDDNEHLDCCSLEASQLKDNESIIHSNDPASVLSETCGLDLFTVQSLKGFLLKRLLNGERPLVAFTLGELFKVSAAILKLKCMLSFPSDFDTQMCSSFRQLSLGTLVGTTYIVLQKIADLSNWPDAFTLVWIDGILRYLEVLGSYFILPELNMPKELYAQIINAHLRAIGKCISLQGKNATLPTHEIGSSTKTFDLQNTVGHDVTVDIIDRQNRLNSFKSRLRMSLRNFVKVASNVHLNTALQVMERALVGVNQHSHSIYEVDTGNLDGGTVSCAVAAGIDCLYLVLESVSGNKRVVKRTVPGLVAALFNIVLHLQGPLVFYKKKLPHQYCVLQPDAGAVVLMCVEVITAFVGKHSFQMDGCHVSQCLHIPVALFKGFKHLLASHTVFHSSAIQVVGQHSDGHEYIIDRQFSVDMYTACCKLLCATLRHQQREAGRCVAVLEDSVNILLGCLESPDTKLVTMEGYFAWNMQESIKCASFFRRIYEEMRQQQDFLGRHSLHFLAGYITMFSGQGPLQTGITREIDEALRPGVYSLIDICEESDFQQLHTYLGEGPCRTTLANLVHDYKLHFQYQGKI